MCNRKKRFFSKKWFSNMCKISCHFPLFHHSVRFLWYLEWVNIYMATWRHIFYKRCSLPRQRNKINKSKVALSYYGWRLIKTWPCVIIKEEENEHRLLVRLSRRGNVLNYKEARFFYERMAQWLARQSLTAEIGVRFPVSPMNFMCFM